MALQARQQCLLLKGRSSRIGNRYDDIIRRSRPGRRDDVSETPRRRETTSWFMVSGYKHWSVILCFCLQTAEKLRLTDPERFIEAIYSATTWPVIYCSGGRRARLNELQCPPTPSQYSYSHLRPPVCGICSRSWSGR